MEPTIQKITHCSPSAEPGQISEDDEETVPAEDISDFDADEVSSAHTPSKSHPQASATEAQNVINTRVDLINQQPLLPHVSSETLSSNPDRQRGFEAWTASTGAPELKQLAAPKGNSKQSSTLRNMFGSNTQAMGTQGSGTSLRSMFLQAAASSTQAQAPGWVAGSIKARGRNSLNVSSQASHEPGSGSISGYGGSGKGTLDVSAQFSQQAGSVRPSGGSATHGHGGTPSGDASARRAGTMNTAKRRKNNHPVSYSLANKSQLNVTSASQQLQAPLQDMPMRKEPKSMKHGEDIADFSDEEPAARPAGCAPALQYSQHEASNDGGISLHRKTSWLVRMKSSAHTLPSRSPGSFEPPARRKRQGGRLEARLESVLDTLKKDQHMFKVSLEANNGIRPSFFSVRVIMSNLGGHGCIGRE